MATLGCRKDFFTDDPADKLSFSTDTVLFDTVFTTVGSTTQRFVIRNQHDKAISISKIMLAGGQASNFRINIDGLSGIEFENIEIPANDSLFAFAEVTLDPNDQNTPLVVTDSVVFITNGNVQDVDLVAWGQDAYFYGQVGGGVLVCDHVFNNDKPHVVYGFVVVDTNCTLTINAGTQLYFHANSGIAVEKGGSLIVNGTVNEPVVFQGDRLEEVYDDVPGQWFAIWIRSGSNGSNINHALIKNATAGVYVTASIPEPPDANTGLIIRNSYIQNASGFGLITLGGWVQSYNTVYGSAGNFSAGLTTGGNYDFRHCTFANYYKYGNRQTPALYISNYSEDPETGIISGSDLQAYFGNCIIDGNLDSELETDELTDLAFDFLFERCMVRVDPEMDLSNTDNYRNLIVNQEPEFWSTVNHDFRINEGSAAVDAADPVITNSSTELYLDIREIGRKLHPDIGANERQ